MQQYKEKNAVAILTFNRSETTKKLMEIMKIIKPPRLYVIIDGPRDSHKGEKEKVATVYKGNIIKNLIMDCQSYTKYRPNETTGGIFVSWRRKEELPTGA